MQLDSKDIWTEAEKLMVEYTNVWSILRDYNEGINSFELLSLLH